MNTIKAACGQGC